MTSYECIQLISSGGLVLVTIGLIYVTWKYMKHTGKMVDEMHEQSGLLKRNIEASLGPIIEASIRKTNKGILDPVFEINIFNKGEGPIHLLRIDARYDQNPQVTNALQDMDLDVWISGGESFRKETTVLFSKHFMNKADIKLPAKVIFFVTYAGRKRECSHIKGR